MHPETIPAYGWAMTLGVVALMVLFIALNLAEPARRRRRKRHNEQRRAIYHGKLWAWERIRGKPPIPLLEHRRPPES